MGMGRAGSIKPPGGGIGEPPGASVLTPSDRDRVLRAFSECCAEQGYQATTVSQVVDRAGVPRETFDLLFTSKEACAIAALNKIASEALTRAAPAGASGDRDRALAGLRAAVSLLAGQHAYAYLACIESRQGGTERINRTYEANLNLISVMISRGPERGTAPIHAARAALGGAEALLRREIAAGKTKGLPRILPALVYGAMAPLLGQADALRVAHAAGAQSARDQL